MIIKKTLLYYLFLCFCIEAVPNESKFIQKPLVIVITSFNNSNWYKKNLDSVFRQKYSNFRIIYIDDASKDGTGELVENYIKEKKLEDKITLIKNLQNQSQMANHYKAVHLCKDDEIVVHLDGDDWFDNENVFNLLNHIYSTTNTWLTHGIATEWPSGEIWPPEFKSDSTLAEIKNRKTYRDQSWVYGHPRSFYAWLFKKIKLRDLLLEGSFRKISPAPDLAFMYPMLEMATTEHISCITEKSYIWNKINPISQHVINLKNVMRVYETVRKWPRYLPLNKNNLSTRVHNYVTAIIFIIGKDKDQLLKRLSTIRGVHKIITIQKKKNEIVSVVHIGGKKKESISYNQWQACFNYFTREIDSEYVFVMPDNIKIIGSLDLANCLREMIITFADRFVFNLKLTDSNSDFSSWLNEDIYAGQHSYLPNRDYFGMSSCLCSKDYFLRCLKSNWRHFFSNTSYDPLRLKDSRLLDLFYREAKVNKFARGEPETVEES